MFDNQDSMSFAIMQYWQIQMYSNFGPSLGHYSIIAHRTNKGNLIPPTRNSISNVVFGLVVSQSVSPPSDSIGRSTN